jgi:alpha-tubulin suppressor-like RCC1 family protein
LWCAAASAALLGAMACGPDATSPSETHITLTVVSGSGQVGTVGVELPTALKVQATNASNQPIVGLLVNFRAITGGGSMYAGTSITDATGYAQDYWTLGPKAGAQSVEVHAVNATTGTKSNFGTFNATANAGAAASMTVLTGNNDVGFVGIGASPIPTVLVTDKFGNPKSGFAITFAPAAGSGSVGGSPATTAADGTAKPTFWSLGAFGTNTLTATGSGLTGSPVTFTATGGFTAKYISGGAYHTCEISGTNKAYCVGYNAYGQLGNGSTGNSQAWVPVSNNLSFSQLANGTYHTCGITTGQDLYCWGYNAQGQLGIGSTANTTVPTIVASGTKWIYVTAGLYNTCAVTTANAAKCWGYGAYNANGDGTTTQRLTPSTVSGGHLFKTVTTGVYHTCGWSTTNVVWCWGYNAYGQVGNGSTTQATTPQQASGGLAWGGVTVGQYHTCAFTTAFKGYCWGYNANGQLGDGTVNNHTTPTAMTGGAGGTSFHSMAAASLATCGLDGSGNAFCWGYNAYGQLGIGLNTNQVQTATAVVGGYQYNQISSDGYASGFCGSAKGGGQPKCWGYNGYGNLGDGSTTQSAAPVVAVNP